MARLAWDATPVITNVAVTTIIDIFGGSEMFFDQTRSALTKYYMRKAIVE